MTGEPVARATEPHVVVTVRRFIPVAVRGANVAGVFVVPGAAAKRARCPGRSELVTAYWNLIVR
jgi:hypothetical protein